MSYIRVEDMNNAIGWIATEDNKYGPNTITPGKFYKFETIKTEFKNSWGKDIMSVEDWIRDDLGCLCMAFMVCKGYFVKESDIYNIR